MLNIKTTQFSGPLDLLLRLIEQEEIDITSIGLAKVTDEYLMQVRELEGEISLKELSDFLEVAARLVLIKSKYLLPQFQLSEDEELSALDLELRLKEYKRFREAGEYLLGLIAKKKWAYERTVDLEAERFFSPPPGGISKLDLVNVLADVVGAMHKEVVLEERVIETPVSLEEKIDLLRGRIRERLDFCLHHLYNASDKGDMAVTFLAMLELLKQKVIRVEQDDLFTDIKVKAHG